MAPSQRQVRLLAAASPPAKKREASASRSRQDTMRESVSSAPVGCALSVSWWKGYHTRLMVLVQVVQPKMLDHHQLLI